MVHGESHPGQVQRVIDECRAAIPKKVSEEFAKYFNLVIRTVSGLPVGVRKSLMN